MIDWTKPVETLTGKPVRVLCTDRKTVGGNASVAVLVDEGTYETLHILPKNGSIAGYIQLRNKPERYKFERHFEIWRTPSGEIKASAGYSDKSPVEPGQDNGAGWVFMEHKTVVIEGEVPNG